MIRIVLLGGGGHASDVLGVIEDLQDAQGTLGEPIEVAGFLDDAEVDLGRFAERGIEQVGSIDDLPKIDATHYVLAVGWPATRHALHGRVLALASDLRPATLVHPTATVR